MPPLLASLLRAALLAAGLVLAGLAIRWLAPGLVAHGLVPHGSAAHGRPAMLTFLALGVVACTVGLPRQAVCFAAGLAFGIVAGLALALVATVLGCTLSFGWARLVGRDWARRTVLRRSRRLASLDAVLVRNPFATVLTLRLLPVGNSLLVSLMAGLSGVGWPAFALATALGALPQTVVFVLLGSGIGLGQGLRIGLAAALFAASSALGVWLMRRGGVVGGPPAPAAGIPSIIRRNEA